MKVRMYLKVEDFSFQFVKDFELSAVPEKGQQIFIELVHGGYTFADVSSVGQYIDKDFFQVVCKMDLKGFCRLHLRNTGWVFSDKKVFLADKKVQKTILLIEQEEAERTRQTVCA